MSLLLHIVAVLFDFRQNDAGEASHARSANSNISLEPYYGVAFDFSSEAFTFGDMVIIKKVFLAIVWAIAIVAMLILCKFMGLDAYGL